MRNPVRVFRLITAAVGSIALGITGTAVISGSSPIAGAAVTKTIVTDDGAGGAAPNYIFPLMPITKFNINNSQYLQYYMYRPLFMPGEPGKVTIDMRLSLANAPSFSNGNKTVTVKLKPYKWSDTEPVNVTDIMLFLNMWHQQPTDFAEWVPGGFSMPTVIKAVKLTSPTTMTFTLTRPLSQAFFLDNQLGAITPMPLAWTVISLTAKPGSGGCAKAPFTTTTSKGVNAAKCKAVFDFLSEQAGFNPTKPKTTINALPTYATSKIWSVVDGPWKLSSFTPTEGFTMVPNPEYSGPNKPMIKRYVDEAFTSTAAIFNALAVGTLDIGALPLTDVTVPAKKPGTPGHLPVPGPNNPRLSGTYNLEASGTWSFTYFVPNLKSNGDTGNAGPILSQLYVRQALQHLIDQPGFVSKIFKNYAVANYSPVPSAIKSPFLSKEAQKNPYPYSVSAAESLLSSHGWKVKPGGTDVCEKPGTGKGDCGQGIKRGAKMKFTLGYWTTPATAKTISTSIKAAASEAGINIALFSGSGNDIAGEAVPCAKGCKWEILIRGWYYTHPLATGTEEFAAGAASNSGLFDTKTSTALIVKSLTGTRVDFLKYEDWEETHLPVFFTPTAVSLFEVHKGLQGVNFNPMLTATPATFHWS